MIKCGSYLNHMTADAWILRELEVVTSQKF